MRLPLLACAALLLPLASCDSADDTPTTFTVTVENVSTPNTVGTDRAMGTVPLSPPAYAVFDGDDPVSGNMTSRLGL